MDREFWIDGFNFFHHWESTRGFLRSDSGIDIVRAIERSIKILAKHLGRKGRWSVVYLDGGLSRHETRGAGLRLRYAGPGRKADDRLVLDLNGIGNDAKLVTVVTNDRELKANCRVHGAACLGVGEFLALLEGKKRTEPAGKKKNAGKPRADDASVLREKTRTLSASEVRAWLEYFGESADEE